MIEDLHARLQRERDDVVARLRELGVLARESTPGVDGTDPARDIADHVQANTRRELGFLTRERLMERAARLQAALERIRQGAYGLCVECGEKVGAARLRAIPEVDTCLPCQERLEKQVA